MADAISSIDWGASRFVSARDGLSLHIRHWIGDGYDPSLVPVFCIPGLTRNSRDFAGLAGAVKMRAKKKRPVLAMDLRGRGLSRYDKDWQNYNLFTELDDVISVLTALGLEHAIFVGTSRGGLLTMMMTAARPGALYGAVLNDVGPVLDGTGLAQIKMYLQKENRPQSIDDAIRVQQAVMQKNFFAFGPDEWAYEAHARFREIDGSLREDFDQGVKKTMAAYDLDKPIPEAWPQWLGMKQIPTLVIRGENSSLLSVETVKRMGQLHPTMRSIEAPGQGHAPMLHVKNVATHLIDFFDGLPH